MNKTISMIQGIPTLMLNSSEDVKEYELIDVRRDDEFNGELGHIQGAKLVTLGPDLMAFLNQEDKEKDILFICRSGGRSANATLMAQQMGFKKAVNMEGGMMGWNELGFPVEKR